MEMKINGRSVLEMEMEIKINGRSVLEMEMIIHCQLTHMYRKK